MQLIVAIDGLYLLMGYFFSDSTIFWFYIFGHVSCPNGIRCIKTTGSKITENGDCFGFSLSKLVVAIGRVDHFTKFYAAKIKRAVKNIY